MDEKTYVIENQKLKDELNAEQFMISQIELLNEEKFDIEGCYALLQNLGKFFLARRVYIYQTQHDYFRHSYEWHEEGLNNFVDQFQQIPFQDADQRKNIFLSSDSVYIDNIADVSPFSEEVQKFLMQNGLKSVIVVPIFLERKMIGFIAIENPNDKKAKTALRLLTTLGNFLGNTVKNKKESLEREKKYWIKINEVFRNSKDAVLVARAFFEDDSLEVISGIEKNDYIDVLTYAEYIERVKKTITNADEKILFEQTLCKENLMNIYKNGSGRLEYLFAQKSMMGVDAVRKIQVQIVEKYDANQLEAIIYIKDVTSDVISNLISKTVISRYCEGAWIMDLNQDLVTGIDVTNYQRDSLSFRGSIKDHTVQISNNMIVPAEQDEFLAKASLHEIDENIRIKEPYVIYATVIDDTGKLSRKKFTHLYLERERNIVFCIMEDNSFEFETEMQLTQEIEKEVQEKQIISKKHQFTDTMFKQLLNVQSSGVLVYSALEKELVSINQAAMKVMDFETYEECEEYLRKGNPRIRIENYEQIRTKIDSLSVNSEPVSFEFQVAQKNGNKVRAYARTKLIELDRGYKVVITSFVDISEKAQLEQELHEERKQYRDALLHNSFFSYTFDINTGIVNHISGNNDFLKYLEKMGLQFPMTYEKFISIWVAERKPQFTDEKTIDALSRIYLRNLYQQGKTTFEYEYFDEKTSSYMRASILMSESAINHHIMSCVIVKNITDMKLKEDATKQALQAAFEAANMANNAKTDFLSRMSHDIRTPMNAIIGMTAIAAAHIDDKERVIDSLEKITSSSKHLLGLINEILDMSKIESGKLELSEEEFNLPELIDSMLTIVKPLVKEKNHNLDIRIQDLKHENVIGDSLRIQQVFVNIMSNAVKYTPDYGNISVTIKEKKENQHTVGCYEFTFEDNGIGMTPEYLEHIFDPFERAKDTRINKIQGTGLGMAITKNIVRLMNGNIQVESKLGEGSKFIVTIYLKLCEETATSDDELRGLSVLVTDDDQIACESTCSMLADIGMDGEWVLSGQEAVDKVSKRHEIGEDYFAIVLDWKMDGMDGIETARTIRQKVGNIPIIVLSAYDWSEIEDEAKEAGVDAFLPKPIFKSGLTKVFKKIVNGNDVHNEEIGINNVSSHDYSGKRILLVEDNELNREIATEILQMTGIRVEEAENGQEAVEKMKKVEEGYYDLIFMDIQMPVMNGYEATRAIRMLKRNDVEKIPILAMTANAFAEDIRDAKDAGMNEHLSKPLELKVLVNTLEKWLK